MAAKMLEEHNQEHQTKIGDKETEKKNYLRVLKCWLSRYTPAIGVISEKTTEGLVIGNRRKTLTIATQQIK